MTVRFAIWPSKPGQMSAWLQGNVVHRHFLRSKVNEHVSWYSWDFFLRRFQKLSRKWRPTVGITYHISHIHIYGQGLKSLKRWLFFIYASFPGFELELLQCILHDKPCRQMCLEGCDISLTGTGHIDDKGILEWTLGRKTSHKTAALCFFIHTLYTFIWLVVSNMFLFP